MYYSIRHSLNTKIIGKFFQSEDILHNYGNIENPKLLNNIYFEKIDFEPLVPIPILHKKAKITDLISCVNATSGGQLIISEKLKKIIEKYRKDGIQYFKTSVIKDNIKYNDFFIINMFEFNTQDIDFVKSKVCVRVNKQLGGTEIKILEVNTLENFMTYVNHYKEKMEIVTLENVFLKDIKLEDFFQLGFGVKHIVSYKLKKEIEDAGCTGIEFQPIELSYIEWSMPNGEREKIYGRT